jgi:hypothetical protein
LVASRPFTAHVVGHIILTGRIPNLWPSIDLFSVYNRCGC